MNDLLSQNFTLHFGLTTSTTIISQVCNDIAFNLNDDAVLIYPSEFGIAKFKNPTSKTINIINYEFFFKSLPHSFQQNKENCDLIVYTNDNSFFSLNELTDTLFQYVEDFIRPDGISRIGKRNKAISQLSNTLRYLIQVPEILNYLNRFTNKRCCFFSKQSSAPTSINAISAFGKLSEITPNGIQSPVPDINQYNFEFWEFYGKQTCEI